MSLVPPIGCLAVSYTHHCPIVGSPEGTKVGQKTQYAVLQSRPSKDGFARLDGHFGKIARQTPLIL